MMLYHLAGGYGFNRLKKTKYSKNHFDDPIRTKRAIERFSVQCWLYLHVQSEILDGIADNYAFPPTKTQVTTEGRTEKMPLYKANKNSFLGIGNIKFNWP
jgi:hypothetical protein